MSLVVEVPRPTNPAAPAREYRQPDLPPVGFGLVDSKVVDRVAKALGNDQRRTDISLLLDSRRLTEGGKARVRELAHNHRFRVAEHPDVWVVGTGQSFQLTNGVVDQWQALEEPSSARRTFARTIRFLARNGIEIETEYSKGSTAHYIPGVDAIGYVMPSRIGLNTLGHEAEHARFERFQEQLTSWTTNKGLAIPYEIDGDADAMSMHFGSFMTLLNELHAHRIGNGLDGEHDDAAILKKLRELYSRTVGEEPARCFAEIWTEERVAGRSVPGLILDSVRRLNALDEDGMLELAQRGWREQSVADMVSFLRLARVRYGSGMLPAEVADWARKLVEDGPGFSVTKAASELLSETEVSGPWHRRWKETRDQHQRMITTSQRWLRRVQALSVGYWPESGLQAIAPLLHHAHSTGLRATDAVLDSLNGELGERFVATAAERQLFTQIVSSEGEGIDDKILAFAEHWQERDFEAVWSEMGAEPSESLKQLILGKHMESLSNAHICELMSWCLDIDVPGGMRQIASQLLEAVFDRRGLRHLSPGLAEIDSRRPVGHELLTPELDLLLSEKLLDGESAMHRLRILDLLLHRAYPEELPRLRARVLDALTRDDVPYNDHRLAAYFLLPESLDRAPSLEWGLAITNAVRADETPSIRALELSAEFYRLSVAHALPQSPALVEPLRLDRDMRQSTETIMATWAEPTRTLCDDAADQLWRLMQHSEPRVWRAALYGIANHPAFVVALESRLAECLEGPETAVQARAIHLAEMLDRGFSPRMDAAFRG